MPSFAILVVAVSWTWLSVIPVSLRELMIRLLVSASSSRVLVAWLGVRIPTIVCLLVIVLKVLMTT